MNDKLADNESEEIEAKLEEDKKTPVVPEKEEEEEKDEEKEPSLELEEVKEIKEEKDNPKNILLKYSFSSSLLTTNDEYNSILDCLTNYLPSKLQTSKIRRVNFKIKHSSSGNIDSTFKSPSQIHQGLLDMKFPKTLFLFRGFLCDGSNIVIMAYHHRRVKYEKIASAPFFDFGANFKTKEFDFYAIILNNQYFVMKCNDIGTGFMLDPSKLVILGNRPSLELVNFGSSTSFFYVCDGEDYLCDNPEKRKDFFDSNDEISWMKERFKSKQNISIEEMEVFSVF